MNFSSVIFLFYFFPISILGYILFSKFLPKVKEIFLIIISLIFYGWTNYKFAIGIVIYSILLYLVGKFLEKKNIKYILWLIVLIIIGVLSYYKYSNFIINNLNRFLKLAIQPLSLIVPIGISFIAFESISYLVDVYRKKDDCTAGSYIQLLSFITFFPKIISGPIILWRDYQKGYANRIVSFDRTIKGIERMIIGLAKKVLIADILAEPVNYVFRNFLISKVDIASCWIVIIAYALELYFDFSGYSDVALGLSYIFGFDFKENFDFPYRSESVSEFWRRWHMSLGTFFREYVYIPLGGNRKHVYLNLFIVFVLTGIWHGSTWPLILWGILHGIMVVIERYIMKKPFYQKIPRFFKWAFTFLFVSFTWILFNMASMGDLKLFIKYLLGLVEVLPLTFTYQYTFNTRIIVVMVIGLIGALIGNDLTQKIKNFFNSNIIASCVKYVLLILLFYIVILFVVNSTYQPFLYFQF